MWISYYQKFSLPFLESCDLDAWHFYKGDNHIVVTCIELYIKILSGSSEIDHSNLTGSACANVAFIISYEYTSM